MKTKLLIIKHTNKTTHIFLSQIVGIIEQDNKWRIMLSDHSYYDTTDKNVIDNIMIESEIVAVINEQL